MAIFNGRKFLDSSSRGKTRRILQSKSRKSLEKPRRGVKYIAISGNKIDNRWPTLEDHGDDFKSSQYRYYLKFHKRTMKNEEIRRFFVRRVCYAF